MTGTDNPRPIPVRQVYLFRKDISLGSVTDLAGTETIIDLHRTMDRYARYGVDLANTFRDGVFRKVLPTAEGPRLISIYTSNAGIQLDVTPHLDDLGPVKKAAEKLIGLSFPLAPFYQFTQKDAVLAEITSRNPGFRPTLHVDPFEMIVSAITAQQINLRFAFTTRSRLVREFGEQLEMNGDIYYAFPAPERLADVREEQFRELQFSGQKSRYICTLARSITSGETDLQAISRQDDDTVVKQLTALLGVGRWTADWFLARFLGRGDAIAAGDLAVKKSIERFYFNCEKVSEGEIRAFAARWGDYTNLAVHYLLTSHVAG